MDWKSSCQQFPISIIGSLCILLVPEMLLRPARIGLSKEVVKVQRMNKEQNNKNEF